jgi:2-keto-3-deoxy-L-rhamnonate aldolase RhmA
METIANLASWFQATNVTAIVRIHKSFAHLIPGILDQGIMGIQVSEVDNAEEARALVRLAKYPPLGIRGISGQGPHTGYRAMVAATPPNTRRGPTKTSSCSRRSIRWRAWRMSRRSRRSTGST